MNSSQSGAPDPGGGGEEPAGAERYLHPGEELRICSSDIQIKKFRFEAYLTNRRLFLIDQNDRKPGVTAKEIPVGSIIGSYLEDSPSHEPVIVLSVFALFYVASGPVGMLFAWNKKKAVKRLEPAPEVEVKRD